MFDVRLPSASDPATYECHEVIVRPSMTCGKSVKEECEYQSM